MAGLVVGLLVAGPRHVLRSPYLWVGGVVALALWAPYLAWQGAHGWARRPRGRCSSPASC